MGAMEMHCVTLQSVSNNHHLITGLVPMAPAKCFTNTLLSVSLVTAVSWLHYHALIPRHSAIHSMPKKQNTMFLGGSSLCFS